MPGKRRNQPGDRKASSGRGAGWRLRVTFTLETAPDSKRIRARALLVLVVIFFAVVGAVRVYSPMGLLAQSPLNLDLALRTVSAGWFEPRHVVPVALVAIDEKTHLAWGSPAVTPREPLVALIERIASNSPLAIVVDIDLAWGGDDRGLARLREFLAGYAGPAPLIFPKRLEPSPGGQRRLATSPVDDLFAVNARLAWAHASFESDSGGVVRQWADWIEVCEQDGTHVLPSVPARVSMLVTPLPAGLRRASPPPLAGSCRRSEDPPGQLLLIGPRLTGPAAIGMSAEAATVPALAVLDPELDRDDAWLFGDRVVLIGATHAAAGDFWLTPSGALPGVEVLAHTVQYAALREAPGWRATAIRRAAALVGMLLLVAVSLFLRGLAAALGYVSAALLFVAIPIWLWDYFGIFEALEIALLLFVFYKFLQAALDMLEDLKAESRKRPPGWRRPFGALWAVCRKPAAGGDTDD